MVEGSSSCFEARPLGFVNGLALLRGSDLDAEAAYCER
jgi:hypothetical protein